MSREGLEAIPQNKWNEGERLHMSVPLIHLTLKKTWPPICFVAHSSQIIWTTNMGSSTLILMSNQLKPIAFGLYTTYSYYMSNEWEGHLYIWSLKSI